MISSDRPSVARPALVYLVLFGAGGAFFQATAPGPFTGTAISLGSIVGSILGGVLAADLTIPGLFAVSAAVKAASAIVIRQAIAARKTVTRT